jgi:hypothetical protein
MFPRFGAGQKEISNTPVVNEEMLDNFDTLLEASLEKLALQCWLAKSTARVGTKLRKLRPCKLQSYVGLFRLHCEARIEESVFNGLLILTRRSRYCSCVNSHSDRYSGIHEVPFHDLSLGFVPH